MNNLCIRRVFLLFFFSTSSSFRCILLFIEKKKKKSVDDLIEKNDTTNHLSVYISACTYTDMETVEWKDTHFNSAILVTKKKKKGITPKATVIY